MTKSKKTSPHQMAAPKRSELLSSIALSPRLGLIGALFAAPVALSAGPASAQTWTGATSNDWTVGSNWSTGVPPTGSTGVIIAAGPGAVLGVNGAATGVSSLVSQSTGLTIENGSTLTSSGVASIGSVVVPTGVATVTGAGSLWSVGGRANIIGTGVLNIQNGGEVLARGALAIPSLAAGSTGTLNVNSGGILATTSLIGGGQAAKVNFDNATLQALASSPTFISAFTVSQLNIGAGGLTVDTNGFSIGAPGFSGAGGLTTVGTGTMTLSDVSTYTGQTTIGSGITLALATSGSIAASSRLVDNGTFDISGLTGTGTSIQTLAGSGIVATGTTLLTLANANDTFAGAFTGNGGLTLAGGTETLTGNSSAFSGSTNVQSGTLAVNGTLGGTMDVLSGATLQGNGTVGATTVHSGGVIAPGNSIGTLSVNGAFTQQSGSTYQVQFNPTSNASDLIAVNGTASLQSGAILNASAGAAGTYTPNTVYKVLSATGGLTGTYLLTGNTGVSAFLNIVDSYDANDVYLKVVQTSNPADIAQTSNQSSTAGGIRGTGIETAVLNSQSDAAARNAVDQLSGASQASVKGAMIYDSYYTRALAIDRLRDMFCTTGHAWQPDSASGPGTVATPGCTVNPDRFAVWGQGFGSWGHSDGTSNAGRTDRSSSGFVIGIDTAIGNNWRVGVLTGYSASNYSAQDASSGSKDYHFGVYGGSAWGPLALRLGGIYTWHDISSTRFVALPNLSNTLSADYTAATSQAFAELGYDIAAGRFNLEPYLNLAYINLHNDGFTEQGGMAALTSRSGDIDTGFTTLGLRASTDLMLGPMAATVRGTLGWMHANGDITPVSVMSFAGGNPFTVTGTPIATDAVLTEAGFDLHIAPQATLGVSYNGQFGDGAIDQSVRGTFTMHF